MTADTRFERHAQELGHDFSGEIKIGGNDTPVLRDGHQFYVRGQIPRVGNEMLFVGAVGVLQLPKGVAVELDLVAIVNGDAV
ncbi:MAG: hypothetical protein AAB176_06045 [Pseudomonadota bacterium]